MSASNGTTKARILVVDDHPVVRDGLIRMISQQSDLMCCAEAGTVAETQSAIARHKPDLVILDLRLKNGDGLELIKCLRTQIPHLRILVLSQYETPLYVERALRAGAMGYVTKQEPAEEVLKAIRIVLSGEVYLTRGMAGLFLHKLTGSSPAALCYGVEDLTDRELHVLLLLGNGMSTRDIAGELGISVKTVETYRENIKHTLELHNASELINFATRWAGEQVSVSPEMLAHH